MGRGKSKIAREVLTYFMDDPFSFFSGNAIYPGRESAAGAASSRLLFEDNGFKLRLDQLEMSDAANYSCQAENFYGRDAITYHLQVKCKPSVLPYYYRLILQWVEILFNANYLGFMHQRFHIISLKTLIPG